MYNKPVKRYWTTLGLTILLMTSCQKKDDPANTVQPAAAQPPTTPPPTTPPGTMNLEIYTDDLQQGGAFLYPGGENQAITFADTSNPSNGTHSIRYAWNGGNVAGQAVFAGMDLMHTGNFADYASTPGKDIHAGLYTRVTFDARGLLPADVVIKVEVADDGNTGTPAPCMILSNTGSLDDSTPGNPVASCTNLASLQSAWQSYSIPVSASNLTSVKDYFKATFIYKGASGTNGSGGTLFLDQILYKP